jgi:hypothetical protein
MDRKSRLLCRSAFLLSLFLALPLLTDLSPLNAVPRGKNSAPTELVLEKALEKARVNDKYAMLLHQFKLPGDFQKHKNFADLGSRTVSEYAGFKDLPSGHWVYVYPHWYIWRDQAGQVKQNRNWGPEQATGAPDTWPQMGDIVTAWASRTPDGQQEWLLLEYPRPVVPKEVHVYETFNPGAVVRVTAFDLTGKEIELWKGNDPTAAGSGKGISKIPCKGKFKTCRIKVYIDSPAVGGWNEIDAVGLIDTNGKTHWAASADASSTFAQ